MSKKLWMSGEEVLERWGAAPFQLVSAVLSRELVAVDLITGKPFGRMGYRGEIEPTEEDCFFCAKRGVNPVCYLGFGDQDPNHPHSWPDDPIYCSNIDSSMLDGGKEFFRANTVKKLNFNVAEVEIYEQAHGFGPHPEALEGATIIISNEDLLPEERRELGRLRLEKEKWDASIKAAVVAGMVASEGQSMTKDQLRGALKQNGVPWAEMPDTTFNKIWAAIPERLRNRGGRPKSGQAGAPTKTP